jgi:hypothetical protein
LDDDGPARPILDEEFFDVVDDGPMPSASRAFLRRPFLFACTAMTLLAGCNRNVSLGYGPIITDVHAPPASKGRIAVARFSDGREEGYRDNQIGRAHSAVGIPGPAVYSEQDPVLWVSDGFVRALTSAGFTVERVDSAATAGDLPTVGGTVRQAFVRSFLGGAGEVRADVVVERGGAQLASASCQGGSGIVVWVDPGVEFRNTLTASLDALMSSCLPQIVPALEGATAP